MIVILSFGKVILKYGIDWGSLYGVLRSFIGRVWWGLHYYTTIHKEI
jgi:hypothetical protein